MLKTYQERRRYGLKQHTNKPKNFRDNKNVRSLVVFGVHTGKRTIKGYGGGCWGMRKVLTNG